MKNSTLILVLFLCVVSACSKKPAVTDPKTQPAAAASTAASAPSVPTVRTALAETRSLDRSLSITGTLQPDESVTVSSEVSGRVQTIRADFGNYVRKGQPLVELDPTEFNLQVDRARGTLNQSLARLGLPAYDGKAQPPTSTPALRQAQAQLEDAKFKYDSAAKLVKSGDVSQERFNEIEKSYRARLAAVEVVRDELRVSWMNFTALEADVKLAEKRRGDTIVRAPFDGMVTEKLVSPGQFVKDNAALLRVVKVDPLRLRVEVPEFAANQVKPGTLLTFTTSAAPGATFSAVVRELNPSLDSKSRTLTAEARLTRPDSRLRPGMFVEVQLITDRDATVVAVPKQAIYSIAGLTKVFVIQNGVAREVRLLPGEELGDMVEVKEGALKPGDRLATNLLPTLYDGMKVGQ